MKATDEQQNQPRRYKAEVKRAKVVRKRPPHAAPVREQEEISPETVLPPEEDISPAEQAAAAQPENPAEEAPPEASIAEPEQAEETAEDVQPDGDEASETDKYRQREEKYVDTTAVMPAEEFEYVVPKETWKQHAKSRHRSRSHSGSTKAATKEEMDEMEQGFVFTSRRRHKRRHHHHHHHRHHRFKHLAKWKKVLIIIGIVLLALIVALTGTFLILREIGNKSMHTMENAVITVPDRDESGRTIDQVDKRGHVITYDGKSYQLNKNLVSVVFIGADAGTGDNEHLQMADAIYILTIDTKTGTSKILSINRDTMVDVDLYSAEGERVRQTEKMQIAFSYAYGSDTVTGGRNTTESLKRLFYGLPFDNYFAINMDALVTLNDAIGGVSLVSSITFQSPEDGRTINAGEAVTLHGKEADYYVRTRSHSEVEANSDRMKRQQEYIRAFIGSVMPAIKKDLSVVGDLYSAIRDNSDTTLNVSKMTYLASTALPKLKGSSDIEMVSLPGTYTMGEFAELNVSREDTIRTMLDVFYTPIG